MKLRVIVVGKDRGDPLCTAADGYLERVRRVYPASLVEVKEEPERSSTPAERILAAEAERIRKVFAPGELVVALDRTGKPLSSEEIAQKLAAWALKGQGTISFVIGGPIGLDPALASAAQERWSLSRLTLPHRLARLVLCEQLYRACSIIRGEPYHK